MSLSKEFLKTTHKFHTVDPTKLEGFDEWALWLEAIFHNPCSIFVRDGESLLIETKQLVERLGGLRIEVYPKEHPPPHFHLKSSEVDASFAIEDCRLLKGSTSEQVIQKVRYWHSYSKPKLIEVWNSTRPTNCTVGKYSGALKEK